MMLVDFRRFNSAIFVSLTANRYTVAAVYEGMSDILASKAPRSRLFRELVTPFIVLRLAKQ